MRWIMSVIRTQIQALRHSKPCHDNVNRKMAIALTISQLRPERSDVCYFCHTSFQYLVLTGEGASWCLGGVRGASQSPAASRYGQ